MTSRARYHEIRNLYLNGVLLALLIMGAACANGGKDTTPEPGAAAAPTTVQPAPVAATQSPVSVPQAVAPPRAGLLQQPRGGWHTATLLPDGRVLVAGGLAQPFVPRDVIDHLRSVEIYTPTTGTWTLAGNMTLTRAGHTATPLDDGTVLVVGGSGASIVTLRSSTEVYDPAGDSWARSGKMEVPRSWHTSAQLPDGNVLIAGGFVQGRAPELANSAEVYDPSSRSWTSTGSMAKERHAHTLTLLKDGKVLAVGGRGVVMAEHYDSSEGAWTEAGSLQEERRWHTATLLRDGKVLVTGGMDDDLEARQSAEIYDPAGNTWSLTGSMSEARAQHTATRLPDGRVLVAGGLGGGQTSILQIYLSGPPLGSAEVYDPSSGTWSPVEAMSVKRTAHAAVLLKDGRVVVIGGTGEGQSMLDSTELFDPATGTWSLPGSEQ